jgi:hypothetical protein
MRAAPIRPAVCKCPRDAGVSEFLERSCSDGHGDDDDSKEAKVSPVINPTLYTPRGSYEPSNPYAGGAYQAGSV